MTPLQFEQRYSAEWDELEQLLQQLREGKKKSTPAIPGQRFAELYRRTCEHLALARSRAYPAHLIDRLSHITADAHQVIYQRADFGWARLLRLVKYEFPAAVREHAVHVWIATAVFAVPLLGLGMLVYWNPELILSVANPQMVNEFEQMYADSAEAIGRVRTADTDWAMFGVYIYNNISIAFRCFAAGLFAGIGSLFMLAFNGVFIGAVAGYLTHRGLGETFYSFVVTHGAFELTAIVLSGAAGLRLGQALLMPGQLTRREALVIAAKRAVVIVYGVFGMLVIAAAVEAFWSSARWIPLPLKYSIAAVCWIAVIAYLTLQGRRAR